MNWLNPFSRITSSGRKYIPEIDGLRFVAITAVIAYRLCECAPLCPFRKTVHAQRLAGEAFDRHQDL